MGIHLVFYFILLLQIQSAASQEFGPLCNETCGDVVIPYPLGIKLGCYNNSWFRVTCNKTGNGPPKPFINRIKMELLNSSGPTEGLVTVNNPVTYLSCGSKGNESMTIAPASVNLTDSPFYFSTSYNMFGSVGCGNWVTLFSNTSNQPIAGCLQQRCSDQILASNSISSSGCWADFPEDRSSAVNTNGPSK